MLDHMQLDGFSSLILLVHVWFPMIFTRDVEWKVHPMAFVLIPCLINVQLYDVNGYESLLKISFEAA